MENYTIYDEIGRGTHSFVYKARRKRSIEYVAVKSTAKTRMEKILNEVQILHKLDSRHVLKFFNWYESQNHIWLIFEYCIGGDLLNLITQDRRLPEPAVKTFGWELVGGLRYLHTNSILYVDLKPANILIDECGSLKLADFGLARRIPTAESMAGIQLAPGSPNYMAPELFQPAAVHSFASDFWALGCVLYELCTGRPPFTNTFFPELARIIQNEPLMIPQEGYSISPSFADLLHRLLEKDPYRRITWDDLLAHPFWSGCGQLDEGRLPAQELFEASRPENRELHNESLSISILHEQHHDACDEANARGERSSITETTSDGSFSQQHSDHDDPPEGPSTKSDENSSESESDSQDELVAEIVGVRKVRPMTAPSFVGDGSVGSKHLNGQTANKAGAPPVKAIHPGPRVKTAPPGATVKRESSPVQPSSSRKSSLIKASRLLFVAADATVKPIAFCNDIESIVVPLVHADQLEFEPIPPDALLTCAAEDLEYHLKSIYISLKSTEMTAAEKSNVLAHLFSLSLMPKLANVILNSSLLTLLMKMLRQIQSHPAPPNAPLDDIASIIMLILGVLIRLGTFISNPSPEHIQNLVTTLNYFLHEYQTGSSSGTIETKRRAVACLGELLFYLAAQPNASLVPAGASSILRAVDDPDLVTRHYAIRTVTNILARTGDESALVHEQTGLALVRCLVSLSGAGDDQLLLKTSVIQALAQLFRQLRVLTERSSSVVRTKLSLLTAISKSSILASVWRGAAKGQSAPELATASLNVLNSYLELSGSRDKDDERYSTIMHHKQRFLEKQVDMDTLVQLLEGRSRFEDHDNMTGRHAVDPSQRHEPSANESRRRYAQDEGATPMLLRAKAILFVHFGVLQSMAFARHCVRSQIVDHVELTLSPFSTMLRTHLVSPTKSKIDHLGQSAVASPRQLSTLDHYLLQCAQNVVRVCIRTALKMSAECISASNTVAYEEGDDGATGQPFTSLIASEPFQLFEQLIKNPACCSQLCYFFLVNEGKEFRYFIRLMAKLLTSFSSETLAAMGSTVGAVISRLLLRLFQSSASDAAALVATEPVELFTHLLPAVVVQLLHPHEHTDGKMEEEEDDHSVNCIQLVYLIMLHLDFELNQTAMQERDHFVDEHLMPCFRVLLGPTRQNENVWRFAVDLLHGLVTRAPATTATLSSQGLVGPILALLSSPQRLEYHSLPSTATALVREVVEAHKNTNNLGSLFTCGIARHVNTGIEFLVTSDTRNAGAVHILEVLYTLLLNRYERRKAGATNPSPAGFDDLVECGPHLLEICARSDPSSDDEEPQDSPRAGGHAAVAHLEILDAGSRCLVYLSQIFGPRLNEVFFGSSSSKTRREEVARSFVTCLQSPHDRVLHYVLLTLKNALRCDAKSDSGTPFARRWLQSDKAAIAEIVRITKRRVAPSTTRETKGATEQVVKTASEILAHFQTAR